MFSPPYCNANGDTDDSYNLTFLFINHLVGNSNATTGQLGSTKGFTRMKNRHSLIMQNGVNAHTLCHEALHARGVDHTFLDDNNRNI